MKKFKPTNPLVNELLTDKYQLTMAYGYWKAGRHDEQASFDMLFRHHPFGGGFTIFAGLEEDLRFINSYRFSKKSITFIENVLMPGCDKGFYEWLGTIDCSKVSVYAPKEGTLVFPHEPLLRVDGPLAIAQLLETTLLCQTGYPSLIATLAARYTLTGGRDKSLLEFGLRRAQGADGAISASRYAYMGGFNATSNVAAGMRFGIPVQGTMAHAFIQSFSDFTQLKNRDILDTAGRKHDFFNLVMEIRKQLGYTNTNDGELASFIAYAQAFPNEFLALVDTYKSLTSGIPNFICVATALALLGYKPRGIRIDSEDLAYVSKEARAIFRAYKKTAFGSRHSVDFEKLTIVGSNDINLRVIDELNKDSHELDSMGIGTWLATCYEQPALGCVYKLMEINGKPRIKLAKGKITIPGRKEVYRLYDQQNKPVDDLLIIAGEAVPMKGQKTLCINPFDNSEKVFILPSRVKKLHQLVWSEGKVQTEIPTLESTRDYVLHQLENFRRDYLKSLNPASYKVSVSLKLSQTMQDLIKK